MTTTERIDVQEGKDLVALVELERGDLALSSISLVLRGRFRR